MTAPQSYASIDIAKFVCALLIVMLHVHIGDIFNAHTSWFLTSSTSRLAVPFFFVSSGFFLARKITYKSDFSYTKSYIIRLLKPLILWLFINTVLEIIKFIIVGKSAIAILITVTRALLFYPYGALWYVYALILGVLLLYFLVKKMKFSRLQLICVSMAMYVFALLCNNYYWVSELLGISGGIDMYLFVFKTARNGFFVGLPFITWGYLLASVKDSLAGKRHILLVACAVLVSFFFFEIGFLEVKHKVDDCALFVVFPLMIPCIFAILLNVKIPLSYDISKLLRNLSAGIYFSHRAFYSILIIFSGLCGLSPVPVEYLFCVLLLSISLCMFCYKYMPKFSHFIS